MKNLYITLLLTLFISPLMAQDFTSKDNHNGNWKNSGTWEGGEVPANDGTADKNIDIKGTLTLEDDLILNNNVQVEVYDTLWIKGNLTISIGSSLTVNSGGVLIVGGILYIEEGAFINNGLSVIIYFELIGGDLINKGDTSELYAIDKKSNYIDFDYSSNFDSEPIGNYTQFEEKHETLAEQIANGTLPIQLLSFTATPQTNSVALDWITAWEENFDFFTVERAGSDLQFKAIGTVQGNGNTAAEAAYSFTDKSPLQGQAFYRLKATDFDGSVAYHKIISVHFDGLAARMSTPTVYPNPVTNHSLKVETSEASVDEVRLLDLNGQMVYTQKAQMGTNEIRLPENIRPGAYVLILLGRQGKQHHQKIMVL